MSVNWGVVGVICGVIGFILIIISNIIFTINRFRENKQQKNFDQLKLRQNPQEILQLLHRQRHSHDPGIIIMLIGACLTIVSIFLINFCA